MALDDRGVVEANGRVVSPEDWLGAATSGLTGGVLEVGTRRWGAAPTHHRAVFPEASEYVMADFMDGEDVDVVSDVHDLKEFENNRFDAFYAASVWEHVEHPWVAAAAVHRVLKRGGWAYVATHHTFPVHGYPSDYTRWTDKGLAALFEYAGFEVLAAGMNTPCVIQKPESVDVWDPNARAYIGVSVFVRKPH